MTTKGGATRPLESWNIETSFLLDKQWQSTTYHSWHDIYKIVQQRRFWPCNETHMKLTSADVPQQALNSLCQFWQKCLFCSVIARSQSCSWNPMGQREVVQKFERVTFLVYGYPTNDKRTFHFQCLENDSCPWDVSLQELFLDWKYDILKEAQKSSKKCKKIIRFEKKNNKVVCI